MASPSSSLATHFTDFKPMAIMGDNYRCLNSLGQNFAPFLKSKSSFSSSFLSLSVTQKFPRKRFQGWSFSTETIIIQPTKSGNLGPDNPVDMLTSVSILTTDAKLDIFSVLLVLGCERLPVIVKSVIVPTESAAGFDEMVSGTQRKYYMLGGKGGVGKTSCAASLAVKFANNGHPTLVVSTDPAHSLSDSFAQDLTGGTLVPVEGPLSPLFALEINPEQARDEFRSASKNNGGSGVKDFMDGMGLGLIADQLGELKLGELLDTPPPGLDEAIAISKVIQFLESQEYNMFTRIVFDTAPTGHTLRLLSLPDFLDASIGKILKLRQKIASATSAIKSVFGQEENRPDTADKLEKLRERMIKVRELFRDTNSTEFVIVTIPTVMAINESSRLCASLKKESVPVKRLVVNQILPPSASDCKFCAMKRKDQTRALNMIQGDPELSSLAMIEAPLVDVEIRGVPALQFLGEMVWK